ncbi:MAG: hypothetical protein JWP38_2562 [Herbaspirillum sp.]|nr:hypothetical protein [Herbaspirillum sp.]
MEPDHPADSPAVFIPLPFNARRRWLQRAVVMSAAGATAPLAFDSMAEGPATGPAQHADLDAFMNLSQALTDKPGLDRAVGARLLAALQQATPDFAQQMRLLSDVVVSGGLLAAPQRTCAVQIVQGWYRGLIGDVVVSYEQALMFDAVSDTIPVRSYCSGAPGFWSARPVESHT